MVDLHQKQNNDHPRLSFARKMLCFCQCFMKNSDVFLKYHSDYVLNYSGGKYILVIFLGTCKVIYVSTSTTSQRLIFNFLLHSIYVTAIVTSKTYSMISFSNMQ